MTKSFWIDTQGLIEEYTEDDVLSQDWIKVINNKSFLFLKYTPSVKNRIESFLLENKQLFKNDDNIELTAFGTDGNLTRFFAITEVNEVGLPDYFFSSSA